MPKSPAPRAMTQRRPDEGENEFFDRQQREEMAYARRQDAHSRDRRAVEEKFRTEIVRLEERIQGFGLGAIVMGVLSGLAQIAAAPLLLACVYKMWSLIQDGHARTTPSKAAFMLLIPFFNLYWAYVAVHGWTLDANNYIERHRLNVVPVSRVLSLSAYCGMLIHSIPVLNLILEIPIFVVLLRWLYVAATTAADIAEEHRTT